MTVNDEDLKYLSEQVTYSIPIPFSNGYLTSFEIRELSRELLERRQADRGWRDKLLRAFTLGREWGETYGGWFCPTDEQEKEHEDAMLSELLPEPPEAQP